MVPLTAVYVYCVVRAARKPAITRVPPGLPSATRPAVESLGRGLWIVIADVPLDVYSPEALEPRLQDLEWVGEVAVAHESVIDFFARSRATTVVPMALFTMFSSAAKARDEIGRGRKSIERTMKYVAGCEEWGIRVAASAVTTLDAGSGRSRAARASRPPTGAAFLAARKAQRDAEAESRLDMRRTAESAFQALGGLAKDARRRDGVPRGAVNPPLLEAAFLVAARTRAKFKTEARRQAALCAASGTEMTLTGPWPAYSFVGSRT